MNRMLRTTALRVIPLLAVGVAAHAIPIYEFNNPVTGACNSGSASCTPGAAAVTGNTTPANGSIPGAAYLNINQPETSLAAGNASGNGAFSVIWSGNGDGALTPTIPVAWDFTLAGAGGSETVYWELEVLLGSGLPYKALDVISSGLSVTPTSTQTIIGSALASTGSIPTLGAWQVILTVDFSPQIGGQGVTISQSAGTSAVELGAIPEPSTWGQAGFGLLFALTLVSRKLRRR